MAIEVIIILNNETWANDQYVQLPGAAEAVVFVKLVS